MHTTRTTLALIAVAAALAAPAHAAPYATMHSGMVDSTSVPGVNDGEAYTVTIIFDNGGTSAASQTWEAAHLVCAIWRFSNGSAQFTQSLAGASLSYMGHARSNPAGALGVMFDSIEEDDASTYTATGFTTPLTQPVEWRINNNNPIFADTNGTGGTVTAVGGVPTNAQYWTAPVRVTAACNDAPYTGVPTATPVPTLGHAGLALLSGVLGAAGWLNRRRKA
jgi:hypothetical protein